MPREQAQRMGPTQAHRPWKAGTDCSRVERVSVVVSETERERERMDESITEKLCERVNGDYYEDIRPGFWFHICPGFLPHILLKGSFCRHRVLTSRLTLRLALKTLMKK